MPQMIFVARPDGFHEYYNKRWYEFTGSAPGERDGDGWSDLLHPDDYQSTLEKWHHSLKTGEPYSVEYRLKKGEDSTYHWFLGRAVPVRDENNLIRRWIGTCTNIQDKKEAEQSRNEIQERYELVNRATFDIIYDWDLPGNRLEWNEEVEAATGRRRDDMPASIKSWHDHIHPEDRDRITSSFQNAIDNGEESWQEEYRFGPVGGPWRTYLDRGFIARNVNGKAYRIIGSMLDLTELKLAREKFKKSEDLLKKVLEVLPVGVFVADQQGRIAQTNPACEKIWGGARHVPIERFTEYKGWWRHSGKRLNAEEWAFARAFIKGETSLDEEIDIECFDGTRKTIVNSAVPIRDEKGEIISAVAVVMDITEEIRAENALRESEDRFRTMADNIAPLSWMADQNGWIFWYSKRWFDYTGTTLEEMQGWGWTKVHHPDHIDRVIKNAERCLNRGVQWEDTFPLRGKDGNYRWFLSRAVPIRDEKGRIMRWFGTNSDITELKEIQKILDSERELLQAIFDSIPVMIAKLPSGGNIIEFNREFVRLTGWTGKEDNILELLYPDPGYRETVKEFIWSTEPGFRDIVITTADGRCLETIWANVRLHDDTTIGIGIDISERKVMEEKLRDQAIMLDQVQDAIVALDDKGNIRYMNDAAYKMYEIERDLAVTGNKMDSYFTVKWDNALPEEEFFRILNESGTWKGENIHVTARGNELWVESVVTAIKNAEGKLSEIISAMRNITDRKEMEKELQIKAEGQRKAGELFENLLYIAAHDLKGPIANMYMALNLFDRIDDIEKKIATLEIFRPLLNRLDSTIKGLTGILQVQKTDESFAGEVYFENVLNDVLLEHRDALYEGNLDYDFSNKPSIIFIEPFLTSILKNLINNAIKYSRENVPLRIRVKTAHNKKGFVLLTVTDNGIGIDIKKHGDQLFTPFKRINPSKAEGTGVGLYIIKSIIEKNGGFIEIKSAPGKGTEFHCYLREYGPAVTG
jgi:PAS domain S-box-containing protein